MDNKEIKKELEVQHMRIIDEGTAETIDEKKCRVSLEGMEDLLKDATVVIFESVEEGGEVND